MFPLVCTFYIADIESPSSRRIGGKRGLSSTFAFACRLQRASSAFCQFRGRRGHKLVRSKKRRRVEEGRGEGGIGEGFGGAIGLNIRMWPVTAAINFSRGGRGR